MKTVSGKIISTKPVKLSKAANILSKFVTSDNGASQAVSAYLRRASAAFNELVYFKKHYKTMKSRSKEETSTKSDIRSRNLEEDEVRVLENGGVNREISQNPVDVDEKGTKNVEGELKKKEKKKKKKIDDGLGSGKKGNVEVEFEEGNKIVKEKSEISQNPVDVDEKGTKNVEGKLRKKEKKKKKIDDGLGSGKNDNMEVEFEEGNKIVKEKSEISQNPVDVDEKGTKNVEGELRKKEKKKKKTDDGLGSGKKGNIEVEFEEGTKNVKEKSEDKKKKKKRKNVDVDVEEIGNSISPRRKKKRRIEAAQ